MEVEFYSLTLEERDLLKHQYFDPVLAHPQDYSRDELLGKISEFFDRTERWLVNKTLEERN